MVLSGAGGLPGRRDRPADPLGRRARRSSRPSSRRRPDPGPRDQRARGCRLRPLPGLASGDHGPGRGPAPRVSALARALTGRCGLDLADVRPRGVAGRVQAADPPRTSAGPVSLLVEDSGGRVHEGELGILRSAARSAVRLEDDGEALLARGRGADRDVDQGDVVTERAHPVDERVEALRHVGRIAGRVPRDVVGAREDHQSAGLDPSRRSWSQWTASCASPEAVVDDLEGAMSSARVDQRRMLSCRGRRPGARPGREQRSWRRPVRSSAWDPHRRARPPARSQSGRALPACTRGQEGSAGRRGACGSHGQSLASVTGRAGRESGRDVRRSDVGSAAQVRGGRATRRLESTARQVITSRGTLEHVRASPRSGATSSSASAEGRVEDRSAIEARRGRARAARISPRPARPAGPGRAGTTDDHVRGGQSSTRMSTRSSRGPEMRWR